MVLPISPKVGLGSDFPMLSVYKRCPTSQEDKSELTSKTADFLNLKAIGRCTRQCLHSRLYLANRSFYALFLWGVTEILQDPKLLAILIVVALKGPHTYFQKTVTKRTNLV